MKSISLTTPSSVCTPSRERGCRAGSDVEYDGVSATGANSQRPCSGVPSNAAKQAAESNLGKQSQSIEPSRATKAPV